MAKRKRAAHEKPFARSMKNDSADAEATVAEAASEEASPPVDSSSNNSASDSASDTTVNADQPNEVVAEFVGKWNQLISTTNWEKGEIICQWRDALMQSGAAVTEYHLQSRELL